jgi:hypothetical protein
MISRPRIKGDYSVGPNSSRGFYRNEACRRPLQVYGFPPERRPKALTRKPKAPKIDLPWSSPGALNEVTRA